jgi:hypothetical protein
MTLTALSGWVNKTSCVICRMSGWVWELVGVVPQVRTNILRSYGGRSSPMCCSFCCVCATGSSGSSPALCASFVLLILTRQDGKDKHERTDFKWEWIIRAASIHTRIPQQHHWWIWTMLVEWEAQEFLKTYSATIGSELHFSATLAIASAPNHAMNVSQHADPHTS